MFNSKWKSCLEYFDKSLSSFLVLYRVIVIKYLIEKALYAESAPIKWLILTTSKLFLVSSRAPYLVEGAFVLDLFFCYAIQTGNVNIHQ